jgi:hypothetical protein
MSAYKQFIHFNKLKAKRIYFFNGHVVILHLIKADVLNKNLEAIWIGSASEGWQGASSVLKTLLMLGVGVENVFVRARWLPVFVRRCYLKRCSWYWVCYFAALLGFSPQRYYESVLPFLSYFLPVNVNVTQLRAHKGTDGIWRYISYPFATWH